MLLALCILVLVGCTDSQPSNGAPVANAGQDRVVAVGDPVTLDGRRSVDPDGDALNYSWRLVTTPEGSNANFAEADKQTATFGTDAKGTYVIELMVTDGEAQSAERVTVEAREELVFEPGTPEEYDPYRTGELIEAEVVLPGATQSTWIGYRVIDGLAIFQGDIVLGRVDPDSGTLATQSTAIDDQSLLWPGGTVYYEIDNSIRLNPVRRYVFDLT
ncbi:MAG: PKD domain-containing protein, partial [Thioalkalivibrio sp.]|nr:PKD domain-containing protein [Thioalkalivibrio sp.]